MIELRIDIKGMIEFSFNVSSAMSRVHWFKNFDYYCPEVKRFLVCGKFKKQKIFIDNRETTLQSYL